MDTSNLLLNSAFVACLLQVTPRTLSNYRSEGRLNYYRLSRKCIRYRVEDVVNFIKQNSRSVYMRDRAEKLIRQYLAESYGVDAEEFLRE
jgi:predicted site-specific integrase-resolvase